MKIERIIAMLGVIFILAMYVAAVIAAFSSSPHAQSWLIAAIFSTVIVPVILYAAQLVYKLLSERNHMDP